jgi:hypothetical protein
VWEKRGYREVKRSDVYYMCMDEDETYQILFEKGEKKCEGI